MCESMATQFVYIIFINDTETVIYMTCIHVYCICIDVYKRYIVT